MKHNSYSLIFDLDGTLIDSLPDMYLAIQKTLNHYKLGSISPDKLKTFVGKGMLNLAENVVIFCGGETKIIPEFYKIYKQHYAQNPFKKSKFMPNAIKTLDYFYNKNVIMSICTNKRQFVAEQVLEQSGIRKYFKGIIGAQDNVPLKPMPDMINILIKNLNVSVNNFFFIGDTIVEKKKKKKASIKSIGVLGGYTEESIEGLGTLTISDLKELKNLFK